MQKWRIEKLSAPNAHRILFHAPTQKPHEFRLLLMSDEHWDNSHCDLKLLKKHHEEAKRINAPILKLGDTFCAMQGKWDKRADQNQIRDEHRGNDYLDQLTRTAAEWYRPYAPQIALIGMGNHEGSIVQRHQTNLIDRLAYDLRSHGSPVMTSGMWGFVRIAIAFGNSSTIISRDLFFHHGYGGGGEVTRGMIDNSRTRGQYSADVYYSGHIHRRNMDENRITSLSRNGHIIQRDQLFLRGSTYKNEGLESSGWHASTGKAGRPLGGYWLRFIYSRSKNGSVYDERVDVIEERAI